MLNVFYRHCIELAATAQVASAVAELQAAGRIPLGWAQQVGKVTCHFVLQPLWVGGLSLLPNKDFEGA